MSDLENVTLAELSAHNKLMREACIEALKFVAFAFAEGVEGAEQAGRSIESAIGMSPPFVPDAILELTTENERLSSDNREMLEFKEHMIQLRETHGFDSWSAVLVEMDRLKRDLESHKRMLLSAACDIGSIGEALGAQMDDDASEIEGLAVELRKDAERLNWLTAQGEIEQPGQGDVRGFIDAAMSKEPSNGR